MLWVVFAILTGVAVLAVLWPLARPPRHTASAALDIAFYRAQIAEIDKDIDRDLVAPGEAEGAKAEAARRLLAAAQAQSPANAPASARKSALTLRIAAVVALLFIPAVTLGLYLKIGHPDWPDEPLEARRQEPPERLDIAMAIARVEAHLQQNPDDGRGYEVLAPAYLRTGRAEDAAHAYAQALRLLGETPIRLALYGEALVYAAGGEVTSEAQQAFEKALGTDAALAPALFYLGLGASQRGDKPAALGYWHRLVAASAPDAPWTRGLEARMAALGEGPSEQASQSASPASQPMSGPNSAAGAAIAAMPEADRNATIRSMVEGLATRLAQNGGDIDGWLRLVRAYKVLNEGEKARAALGNARRRFADDRQASARLDALARELGLEG